jgi:GNAT superfamily N-acetyltransferase
MASAFVTDDLAGFAMLAAMWVEPERRRQGIGRALVEAAAEWARERGVQQLRLWVGESNVYTSTSFEPTVASHKMPGRESVREMLMVRTI